ncbi:MAG TPA: hypothetical protein VGD80_38275 [Kofleriaceae bacterium]
MSRALDPERSIDDAFLDAVVGLDSFCRALGLTLDDAIQGDGSPVRAPDDLPEDLIDALLGLVSVRTTVALVVAAASSASPRVAPAADAASLSSLWSLWSLWSREQLR